MKLWHAKKNSMWLLCIKTTHCHCPVQKKCLQNVSFSRKTALFSAWWRCIFQIIHIFCMLYFSLLRFFWKITAFTFNTLGCSCVCVVTIKSCWLSVKLRLCLPPPLWTASGSDLLTPSRVAPGCGTDPLLPPCKCVWSNAPLHFISAR